MIRARTTKKATSRPQQASHGSRNLTVSSAAATDEYDEDDGTQDDRSKKRRRRRRKLGPVNVCRICAGTVLSVAMMVFMAVVDFQPANKVQKEPLIHRVMGKRGAARGDWPAPTPNGSVCWFDGHCPDRHVCSPDDVGFGSCTSYGLPEATAPDVQPATRACVEACSAELQIDEHFYHETWANVEASYNFDSESYPSGCRLVFQREPEGNRFGYLADLDRKTPSDAAVSASVAQWVDTRFRHVKRVDPLNSNSSDPRWLALCSNPCQTDSDCFTRMSKTAFVCQQGSCQRSPDYWPTQNVTIVTAASAIYFSGLTNLVASARYWAPQTKVVVYNLGGMSSSDKDLVLSWPNVLSLEWPDGVPQHYPPHVAEGKKYAWKPIIVNETVHRYGTVFWLDAGSTLAGPIDPARDITQRQGIMLVKGQDLSMDLSHPDTYQWFGYDKATYATGPHFSGNTQAFLYPSRYIDSIVVPNARCALESNCIAPPGSFLRNHRYDQTTISILAYQPKVQLGHYTEFLAAQKEQLNPDLAQPSFKFVWTARQGCQFYARMNFDGNTTTPTNGRERGQDLTPGLRGPWGERSPDAV